MAVKLVGEFWTDVQIHETLIRKCFYHLFRRYPDPDAEELAWNKLMIGFQHLNILSHDKFDPKRGAADKTEEKKWEQYIYTWVNHFMEESFNQRGKYYKRFKVSGDMDDASFQAYEDPKSAPFMDEFYRKGEVAVKTLKKDQRRPEKLLSKTPKWGNKACFPTTPTNPLDKLEYQELIDKVQGVLKNDLERTVFKAMHAGCVQTEVAIIVNRTPAGVSAILKRIRERCAKKGILPTVCNK